jgi:acetylornithine deacetylase/succinyl-diaminopimelate desuccinylase-like protein
VPGDEATVIASGPTVGDPTTSAEALAILARYTIDIPANVRAALQGLVFGGDPGDPAVDPDWGEPGLTPAERVIAWNTLEVLAYRTGNPDFPVNAIPPAAKATMHMRFVVGTEVAHLRAQVQAHLAAHGFGDI